MTKPTDTQELDLAIGMLRQWLNEDRIKDAKRFVTNEELHVWLDKAIEQKYILKSQVLAAIPEKKHTWDYSEGLAGVERIVAVNSFNNAIDQIKSALGLEEEV